MTIEFKELIPFIALAGLALYWKKMLEKSRKKAKIVIPVKDEIHRKKASKNRG